MWRFTLLATLITQIAFAQHTHAYLFGGFSTVPGSPIYTFWQGTYIHTGGGGEAALGQRFTVGGEAGALIATAERARSAGLFSGGPSFHFIPRSQSKLDPFVSGGASALVRSGASAMFYYGGGVNYWVRPRLGIRMEFRDHVWSPEGSNIHFVGARIGICVR